MIQKKLTTPSQVTIHLFQKIYEWSSQFETARDTIRHELHSQSPAQFPYGIRGTSVAALTSAILPLMIL